MVRDTTGIGIDCTACGQTSGHYNHKGDLRCDECGRFASASGDYCALHDVDESNLPTGYGKCPYCAEQRRLANERMEIAARRADPRMHPTVDAPRW